MNALCALLLATASLFDSQMSTLEKKKTGIAKLNEREKKNLQTWLAANYFPSEEVLAKAETKTEWPTITEILNNGTYVRLSDGTLWEVTAPDTAITQGWITPAEIEVKKDIKIPGYPYLLTNNLTGSSVHARPATKVPAEPQPAPTPPPKAKQK